MSPSAGTRRVADVMARDVEFVDPGASVQEAAILMGEIEVGALPVGAPDHLDGIVTDRDILYRVVARGRDPRSVTVRDVASRPVLTCRPGDDLRVALDIMAANYVRRLAVREGDVVVGWLTLADVARHLVVGEPALQAALGTATEGWDGDQFR